MVSVDTPRESQVRRASPTAETKLDRCRCHRRLQDGTYQDLPEALGTYLVGRLTPRRGRAAHYCWHARLPRVQALPDRRLTRPEAEYGVRNSALAP